MDFAIRLFFLVAGSIIKKLALPFIGILAVAILVVGGIASASGGAFGVAALYTLYAGLAVAVLGTIIGAVTTVFGRW